MPNVAVIGNRDAVLAFKAVGFLTYAAETPEEALSAVKDARKRNCSVVFITEPLAVGLEPQLKEFGDRYGLSVSVIPDNRQKLGLGFKKMKAHVEKAIGVDILFKEEGRDHEPR
ncbi:MAG: V-type ATP synthase subunit F [Bacillota bacterium]